MQRKLKIIAVGKIKAAWINAGLEEYRKRLPGLTIVEIKDSDPAQEWAQIQTLLKPRERLIALTERGQRLTSLEFADFLQRETLDETLVFAIGSATGISPQLEATASHCLSLSPMTFTHDMARLLLVEQLYRAHNILNNGSYHK
jgi:23S rRNA (pseudouridine1915-N3)-methyltransferase